MGPVLVTGVLAFALVAVGTGVAVQASQADRLEPEAAVEAASDDPTPATDDASPSSAGGASSQPPPRASGGAGLDLAAYPGPDTTGPVSSELREVGDIDVDEAGTVLEGLSIGCLDVNADDVVVRDSVIRCDRDTWAVHARGARLLLQDVEVDGMGVADICIAHDGFTLERADVHNCSDGVRANGEVVIVDSWIHDLARTPGSHNDSIQTTQGRNIRIEGNTLEPYRADTDDPMNAAYILKEDQGDIDDVVFSGNYVNGGNFTLFVIGEGMENVSVTDNVFGRDHRYGPLRIDATGIDVRGNVYADNGEPVDDPS